MKKWLKRLGVGIKNNNSEEPFLENDVNLNKPEFILDLSDPSTISNFKDISNSLKKNNPVCPLKAGGLLLLDSQDVRSVFTNKLFSNKPSRYSALAPKNKAKYTAAAVAANIPPFLDAPDHIEVRRWLTKSFYDHFKIFEQEVHLISQEHSKSAMENHQYLLVEELARDFVIDTMARFVGISAPRETIKAYTSALFRLFAPAQNPEIFEQTNTNLQNARDGLLKALSSCREKQTSCLLTALDKTSTALSNNEQSRDQMIADNALLVLADGIENVEAAIGQVMMQWFEQENGTETISADFVRQCIHKDTPGQTIPRIASEDMVINGHKIGAGTPVFLSLASANMESKVEDGFSFGLGRHRCIGEPLAISMITAFCNELVKRQPKVDTTGLQYVPIFGHKWPRSVKIILS